MRYVERPGAQRKGMTVLSDEQGNRFFRLLDKPSLHNKTLYVAFGLMRRLGLGVGEVCNLRLSDLSLDRDSLLVRGKRRKQRRLAVRNGVRRLLEDYPANVQPEFDKALSDGLFLSCTGRALGRGCLRKSFRLHASRAGVAATPRALPHYFRHKSCPQRRQHPLLAETPGPLLNHDY